MDHYPSYRALVKLNEFWPTPDGMNFCVYEGGSEYLLGHVSLSLKTNSYLGEDLSEKYSLHIQQIVVADELRGCGIMGVICKRLIDAVEDAGAFIHGVARNFNKNFPAISNSAEYLSYLEDDVGGYIDKKENEFKSSKALLNKYLYYGFRRYDGSGYSMMDRRWKKFCFGYKSTKLKNEKVLDFLNKHLA